MRIVTRSMCQFLAVLFLASGGSVQAQNLKSTPADGTPPVALTPGAPADSYALSGFEQINRYNGHLNISLPLLGVGGRGEARFTIHALVSRPSWIVETSTKIARNNNCPIGQVCLDYLHATASVQETWQTYEAGYGPGILVVKRSGDGPTTCWPETAPSVFGQTFTYLVFLQPDGTELALYDHDPAAGRNGQPFLYGCQPTTINRGRIFRSRDGSGASFTATADIFDYPSLSGFDNNAETIEASGTIHFPDGRAYEIQNGLVTKIRDRNGNHIQINYLPGTTYVSTITDPLGRTITIEYNRAVGSAMADVIWLPGESVGADPVSAGRRILIYKSSPSARLRPGLSPVSPLFQEILAPNYGPSERISEVVLPNNKKYEFYFNSYGEVARAVLPTGGRMDYDHGPGLAGNVTGVYASGQVLDPLPTGDYGSNDVGWVINVTEVRPPLWKPYIYRRMQKRREYAADGALLQTQIYLRPETATEPYPETLSGRIRGVAVTVSPYTEVQTASSVGASSAMTERHWFHPGGGFPTISRPGAPYQSLTNTVVQFIPPAFEGKEYKTETVGVNTTEKIWTVGERLTPQENKSYVPVVCQENTTLSGMSTSAAKLIQYDRNEAGEPLASGLRFENQSDVYEYDFSAAIPLQTQVSGSDTYYVCGAVPSGYARRTHTEYLTSATYVNTPVHLRALPVSVKTWNTDGTMAAESKIVYDSETAAGEWNCTVSRMVGNPGTLLQHDDSFLAGSARGNVVCTARRVASTGGWATTMAEYEKTGNATRTINPRGNATTVDYTDNFLQGGSPAGAVRALPKTVTNSLGHAVTKGYDYKLGVPVQITDENDQITTLAYNDPLDRLKQITLPIGMTQFQYDDDALEVTTLKRLTTAGRWLESKRRFDSFGRPILDQVKGPNSIWTKTETQYDGFGRAWRVSNPLETASAEWWTVSNYDAGGRRVSETAPDGAVTNWNYTGESVEITDPAGKKRKQWSDGLGRLVRVAEDPNGLNYQTVYTYGAKDELRTVAQGSQTRTFEYDLLARLKSATNPESGTITYDHDPAGNLTSRISNGNTAAMSYDAVNRTISQSYSGPNTTPAVSYCYDGNTSAAGCSAAPSGTGANLKGRLTMVANSEATVKYSAFDALGRVTAQQTAISGQASPFNFSYEYNDLALTAAFYPSGRRVTYSVDDAGRINAVSGVKDGNTTNYAVNVSYSPHGGISSFQLAGARTEQWCYNNRMQPTAVRVGAAASANCAAQSGDLLRLGYTYWSPNNGNLQSQSITRPSFSAMQSYSFDALNRLSGVTEGSDSRTFDYSQYGNMWVATASTGWAPPSFTPRTSAWYDAKNRLVNSGLNIQYDNAGNQTGIGGYEFTYDAENRVKTSTIAGGTTTFAYDGEGRRVKKGSTVFVYDAFGQLAAEYGGTTTPVGTQYLTADHLGSTRLVTDAAGTEQQCHDYLPFGEEITQGAGGRPACYAATNLPTRKFTGKERDAETSLDYFEARYYSGAQGRFTSPDPEGAGATAFDPQSWNMYAYGRNNPLKFTDPTGMNYTVCDADGRNCRDLTDAQYADYRKASPNIVQSANGTLYARNDDGTKTKVGSAQYYNEKPFEALSKAGHRASRDISTSAILIVGYATAFSSTYAAPAVLAVLGTAATSAPTVAVVFRAQQLAHAMRVEPGHNTPSGTIADVKTAVEAAVKAGSYTVGAGGVVKGTAYIQGVAHEFTGFMRTANEMVFSNIYRK